MADTPANRQFQQFYDQFADAIFRHCYYRLDDRERAGDLVQETFLRTWQYVVAGHTIDNIRAFLYRVANNLIIDERRKRQLLSLDQLHDQGFEPASNAHHRLHHEVNAAHVISVLKRLDQHERDVIMMRYVDGLKPKEIADVLEETPNVISVRLHRAVKHLQTLLHTNE